MIRHDGVDPLKVDSDTGTRTLVSCVKGKYANHLHNIGTAALEDTTLQLTQYVPSQLLPQTKYATGESISIK